MQTAPLHPNPLEECLVINRTFWLCAFLLAIPAVPVMKDVAESTGYGSVGDFGWDGAASTFFRIDPKEDLAILVMTQRMPTDLEIQVKVKNLVYQALLER
jgi:CubicO group peptidase (beta-lactamase class C family)